MVAKSFPTIGWSRVRKPEFAPAQIEAFLRARFGRVEGIERLAEGDESQAFGFRGDGAALICRINRSRLGFDKDGFAHRHFASEALPVPAVLSIEPFGDHWLSISVRASGETLQALGAEAADLGATLTATMDAMAATNVSMLDGFGAFATDGRGDFAHWRDYLAAIADPAVFEWAAVSHIVSPETVQPLLEIVRRLAPKCPDVARLVHGDFGSNNVLAAGGAITGVIDWSEAMLGDPLYDVANIFFWRSWLACMEAQALYFETRADPRLDETEKLTCYQLRIGLQALYDAATDGDTAFVGWVLDRCRAIAAR
jgi:hygromycin-B 4-O-kinase